MTAIFLSYGLLCMAIGFGLNWYWSRLEAKQRQIEIDQLKTQLRWGNVEKEGNSYKVEIKI